MRMDRTRVFHDLSDALVQPGCPVCRLRATSGDWLLESLLWESVTDPSIRLSVRRARGFCQEHALGLVRIASAMGASLGVAIITRDVLEELLRILEGSGFNRLPSLSMRRVREALDSMQPAAATAHLVGKLKPQANCPACTQVDKMERIYLTGLATGLTDEEGLLAAYRASDGLCLPHFRKALTLVSDQNVFETLVGAQIAIWQRLVTYLGELIRKHDWRFQDEAQGEETGAWLRAISALVGATPRSTGQ